MVELNPQELAAFFKNLDPQQIASFFQTFQQQSQQSVADITNLQQVMTGLNEVTDQSSDVFRNVSDRMSKVPSKKVASGLGDLNYNTSQTTKSVAGLAGQFGLLTLAMGRLPPPTLFDNLGKSSADANLALTQVTKNMGQLLNLKADGSLTGTIFNYLQNISQLADSSKENENNFLALAARSGELGELLINLGDDLSGLSPRMEKFSELTSQVGNASGFSSQQIAGFAVDLMKIPGAMDTSVKLLDQGTESIHLLDASLKIAQGSGQTFSQVTDQMSRAFEDFGEVGKIPLENISKISSVSQNLKIPLELVKNYALDAGSAFKMLGDNTQGSLKILDRFGPSLKQQGLGAKSIIEVVSGITRGIEGMGIAQKAYLSSQTGGAGGLQGAYQIESLLKKGKLDEVYKKVEQNLRQQFGGNIVTMDQAGQSQAAAAQYTKQVKLLQSPSLGGIAKSDDQAYQIIEALAKGEGIKGSKTAEQDFSKTLEVGNEIQQRQYNVLVSIENQLERMGQLQGLAAYDTSRQVLGSSSVSVGEGIAKSRLDASQLANQTQLITGQGLDSGQNVNAAISDALISLPEQTNKFLTQSESIIKNLFGLAKSGVNEVFGQSNYAIAGPTSDYKSKNDSSVNNGSLYVTTVCQNCQQKIANVEATRVVNQALSQQQQNQQTHNHIGIK